MSSPLQSAIKQICDEKGISEEAVIETIEHALAAAYRKDFAEKTQNIKIEFDPSTSQIKVFDVKIVMDPPLEDDVMSENTDEEEKISLQKKEEEIIKEEQELSENEETIIRFNPKLHISLSDARDIKPNAEIGDEIRVELSVPGEFGRMAAQTAKQVIIQKLREAERNTIYDEFKDHENEIMIGEVQRREGPNVLVDFRRVTAILPFTEQIPRERYHTGLKIKVYILAVSQTPRGPEIIVSRKHPEIVRHLFISEIPEIAAGTVEIKGIAREAGGRTKISVFTDMNGIDPIGSCVGQRGTRIQSIISELGGEKIDIILYNESTAQYIMNALSPAKAMSVKLNEDEKTAIVTVKSDQLSLAIGKNGQNIRLASALTGWQIKIQGEDGKEIIQEEAEEIPSEEKIGENFEIKENKEENIIPPSET